MFYIFYKVINKVNDKFYYGVHQQKDKGFDGYLGSGLAIKNAIKKHGKTNFIREDIETFKNKEEAYEFERNFITKEIIEDKNCYNMMKGGFGGWDVVNNRNKQSGYNPMNDASVRAKSIKNAKLTRSKNPEMYSTIARNNLRNAHKNQIGKKRTEETKKKISASNQGKRMSKESRAKMSESWSEERKEKTSKRMKERIVSDETKNKLRNRLISDKTRIKMSEAWSDERKEEHRKRMSDMNRKLYTCEFCGKSCIKTNWKRWHGSNCKQKGENK